MIERRRLMMRMGTEQQIKEMIQGARKLTALKLHVGMDWKWRGVKK